MGAYLVMKNNLRREFLKKSTYFLLALVPLAIAVLGSFSLSFSQKNIRVGILSGRYEQGVKEFLNSRDEILYENANRATIRTDCIMGKYEYVIDCNKQNVTKDLRKIESICKSGDFGKTNDLSESERMLAALLTVYMVIATIYATKVIKDKEMGVLERFYYSGNSKRNFYLGYVGSVGVMILLQISIAFAVFYIVKPSLLSYTPVTIIISILGISVFTTAYGVFFSRICKTEMAANLMASSAAIVLSLLGGTFVAVERMPAFLQAISVISPVRWLLCFL